MNNQFDYQFSFEKLRVWQQSLEFAIEMHHLTKTFPRSEQYELGGQLRRASFSVPNNLAEGSGRHSGKDKARFTETSYSSLMESMNALIFGNRINLIKGNDLQNHRIKCIIFRINSMPYTTLS